MRNCLLPILVFCVASWQGWAQGVTRQTYHDKDRKNLKEVYQVKDTVHNILHGRYISYYLNGKIESRGQFTSNETSGIWEFFYENGKLKMRGILFKSANYGLWEYFFEDGQKSMEGIIYGKNREGEWKMYYENGQVKEVGEYKSNKRSGLWRFFFEDGTLKGEIEYTDDFGRYTEYYHSGKVLGEGPKTGMRNTGHWRFFAEDGTLQSEGDFANGKKQGEWVTYYSSGTISSKGGYIADDPTGPWTYYFEDGGVSSTGKYATGKRDGYWKMMTAGGAMKSETTYTNGVGTYREYYPSGKLKVKGQLVNDKRQGKWEYFYEDGKAEGVCEFDRDKGTYYGYYPNGNLQTKGTLEGELKTGTWEIYESDGKLSGYYRPFYDDRNNALGKEISALAGKNKVASASSKKKKLSYFDSRFNEFRGVIVGSNPIWIAAGRLPVGVEFYLQERLGHEFEFTGIRDPFFKADLKIPAGKQFSRGYNICIKQKFYNTLKAGMWYFGQEIRFTNLGHFVNWSQTSNPNDVSTFNSNEQKIEWGALLGYRIMKRNNAKGFTIDTFISGDIGYRAFDVDPEFATYFADLNQSHFATSFHFGLNLGNVFSFR